MPLNSDMKIYNLHDRSSGYRFPVLEDGQEPIYLHDSLLATNFKTGRILEVINQVFFSTGFEF